MYVEAEKVKEGTSVVDTHFREDTLIMTRRKRPRNPLLNPRFAAAVEELGIAFKKSSVITHQGNKGGSREEALREFFRERLPTTFAVTQGEVVDLLGAASPQLDLMFYDQAANFALHADESQILPAEALLASIEVKSTLNATEIAKSVTAARKLRHLRPFGSPLGGTNIGLQTSKKVARYFHCVFAYNTDIAETDWIKRELLRFASLCGTNHLIDMVYVLNRGTFNVPAKIGRLEDHEGGAMTNFYFSILNFVLRENERREKTPFERYTKPATKAWSKIV